MIQNNRKWTEFKEGVLKVWRRNWMVFSKTMTRHLLWIVVEPLVIYFSIGYGLGTFISDMQGISYADFFFPSILAMTSMMVAFYEGSYGTFPKLHQLGTYSNLLTTPIEPEQVVAGECLWAATKGTISALGVAIVAGFFGHLDSIMYAPAFIIIFLSSFLFGAFGIYLSTNVKTTDEFILPTACLIVPMSLISGTYFSLDNLPFGLKYISYVLPLSHTVSLIRSLVKNPEPIWATCIHILVLITLATFFVKRASRRIRHVLID